jgi:hypothetical protein
MNRRHQDHLDRLEDLEYEQRVRRDRQERRAAPLIRKVTGQPDARFCINLRDASGNIKGIKVSRSRAELIEYLIANHYV